ncbi:hypothetical protein [Rhodococcus sovatensis]|uniref:Uncharacterized protein n=1 Tax=Rhodococcus sovatensis TaxID=1805840 RepID=A0ABZ2PPH8_9NOCA
MPTSAIAPSLSRRSAIRLAAGAALATVGLVTTAGCSSGEDTAATVDTLTTHLRRARKDADMAAALIAILPERVNELSVIQSERSAHADSLAAEIDRVSGGESIPPSTPSTTTTTQVPPPTLEELLTGLSESGRSAADSARNESGYRAGLLGSISAACTVQSIVVLA